MLNYLTKLSFTDTISKEDNLLWSHIPVHSLINQQLAANHGTNIHDDLFLRRLKTPTHVVFKGELVMTCRHLLQDFLLWKNLVWNNYCLSKNACLSPTPVLAFIYRLHVWNSYVTAKTFKLRLFLFFELNSI